MVTTPVDYQLLAIFAAVADESSFSRAAKRLGITKGTASRAIARLESIVGAELLHRTTRHVALSTAGSALYERSAPHLTALDNAVLELPERDAAPAGELRLTAPMDFGALVLPGLLSQFARRYPQVSFDVRLANAKVDIVADGFDLAIRAEHASMRSSTLTVRRLGAANGGLYAAPSYLARRGRPGSLGDPEHAWIMHPHAMSVLQVPRLAVRFRCDDFSLARDLARDGEGIALLPNFVADPHVRDGSLERVGVSSLAPVRTFYVMLYPSSGQVPRKVSAFRDFVVDRLRRTPLG